MTLRRIRLTTNGPCIVCLNWHVLQIMRTKLSFTVTRYTIAKAESGCVGMSKFAADCLLWLVSTLVRVTAGRLSYGSNVLFFDTGCNRTRVTEIVSNLATYSCGFMLEIS